MLTSIYEILTDLRISTRLSVIKVQPRLGFRILPLRGFFNR
jgi:hypothetical protein